MGPLWDSTVGEGASDSESTLRHRLLVLLVAPLVHGRDAERRLLRVDEALGLRRALVGRADRDAPPFGPRRSSATPKAKAVVADAPAPEPVIEVPRRCFYLGQPTV